MTGTASLRSAQLRLGGLALVALVAGALPWIKGGPLYAQLLGIPFLALGLFCAFATYRLPRVAAANRPTTTGNPAYPAEPAGGCACGSEGGCCGGGAPEATAADVTETDVAAANVTAADVTEVGSQFEQLPAPR
ncbi:MAG TPA: hypothetical protein VHX59_17155 [Mycobacteriales bacterium]|jgi:hypothetical protein|nr:hypothetical protein [Mycobacteriales bacterium]